MVYWKHSEFPQALRDGPRSCPISSPLSQWVCVSSAIEIFWKKFQESLIFLISPHEGELLIYFKKRTLWTRFNTLVRNAFNETVVKVVRYNSFWTCWLLIDFFSLFPNILFTSSVSKSWVWWLQPFPELDDNFKGRKKQVSFLSQYGNILTLLSALKPEDGKEHTLEASFWCHNVIQSNWMNIHVF